MHKHRCAQKVGTPLFLLGLFSLHWLSCHAKEWPYYDCSDHLFSQVRVRRLTVSCEIKTNFHGFWAPNWCKEHLPVITGYIPNNNIIITGNYLQFTAG